MPNKPSNFETDSNGYGDVMRPASTSSADDVHSFGAGGDLATGSPLQDAGLSQAKEQLAERVADAKHALSHAATTIADRARSTAAVTDSYVRQSPWQAVGIAAAAGAVAGLVFGVLLARR